MEMRENEEKSMGKWQRKRGVKREEPTKQTKNRRKKHTELRVSPGGNIHGRGNGDERNEEQSNSSTHGDVKRVKKSKALG